ncbi:TetR family transcriptional regulator [Streptomyces sp. NPDC086766]|uniref:TetR family transcriptional regulator n=1 Tax=Streptomyces sp. NPDC086766 TaxID=3365754 RepID=UPI003825E596
MVKQARALRTRTLLIKAAAHAFNADGFHGASLSQICKRADISMGALTFHFSSKAALADAVEEDGWSTTRTVVQRINTQTASPLQSLTDLVTALSHLLESDPLVRCAVRLSRERARTNWTYLWLPAATRLTLEAHRSGHLNSTIHPDDVTTLITLLLNGTQHLHATANSNTTALFQRSWNLALNGITPPDVPCPHVPRETRRVTPAARVTTGPEPRPGRQRSPCRTGDCQLNEVTGVAGEPDAGR